MYPTEVGGYVLGLSEVCISRNGYCILIYLRLVFGHDVPVQSVELLCDMALGWSRIDGAIVLF
jgi:hypothetical protein